MSSQPKINSFVNGICNFDQTLIKSSTPGRFLWPVAMLEFDAQDEQYRHTKDIQDPYSLGNRCLPTQKSTFSDLL